MESPVAQRDLQCVACAGQCAFSPQHQSLVCVSCGTSHAIAHDDSVNPAEEFHYHPDTPHTEQTVMSQAQTHVCETCGGEVVFLGAALSERCAYCDGPVVLKAHEASYQTLGLVPFAVAQDVAQQKALAWARSRVAAPGDLDDIVARGRVAGLYAPFWTFDSHEAVDYMARYRVKQGDNWETRTTSGGMNIAFDDLLMPASPHVTPLIRDGILHEFSPLALRPYDPAFLAGFAAERHHQSVTDGLRANAPDKDLLIRNRIRQRVNRNNITSISYKTHTTGIRYRRILLPVWILHYSYHETPMKIVVCGIHGRTYGERPYSNLRLAGWAALVAAATITFGWMWGAAQLI